MKKLLQCTRLRRKKIRKPQKEVYGVMSEDSKVKEEES